LGRRLGGPQSRSGRSGEGQNPQPLPGLEHPIIQPVAQFYATELSWLQFLPKVLVVVFLSLSLSLIQHPSVSYRALAEAVFFFPSRVFPNIRLEKFRKSTKKLVRKAVFGETITHTKLFGYKFCHPYSLEL
jgi:hypothetical protein